MNTKLKKVLVIGGLASAACSLVASVVISSVSYYKSLQSEKVVEEQKEKIVYLEKDLKQKEVKINNLEKQVKELCINVNKGNDHHRHMNSLLYQWRANVNLVPDKLTKCQQT